MFLLCEGWIENYRGIVFFQTHLLLEGVAVMSCMGRQAVGKLPKALAGSSQCKDEGGQAREGRGPQALRARLSLESSREWRWAPSKASWSSAWTVHEAKPQICLLWLGNFRPALLDAVVQALAKQTEHWPAGVWGISHQICQSTSQACHISMPWTWSMCVALVRMQHLKNVSSLQSFILMKRTGFIEKILSIKVLFVLHCPGAHR